MIHASQKTGVVGAGLGLRRGLASQYLKIDPAAIDFLELAPENWIALGGSWGDIFAKIAERFPLAAHGLALSLGSTDPLNLDLVSAIGDFLNRHNIDFLQRAPELH